MMKKLTGHCSSLLQKKQLAAATIQLLLAATLWTVPPTAAVLPGSVGPLNPKGPTGRLRGTVTDVASEADPTLRGFPAPRTRRRRAVLGSRDMSALLDYHNRARSQVFPPAANMEYMVWDEALAKSADSWASRCVWEHGPTHALRYMGQNLSISSGRYRSIADLVRSWHDERRHFAFPSRCSGSVCSHYTQMVWASTSRVGCALRKCSNIQVFGSSWKEATLLVCNYSVKGNWVGEAPYRVGRSCSDCPSSYGGGCWRNQCTAKNKRERSF